MSIASLKKKYSRKFKKDVKSQIFILGSVGVGKSSLTKILQHKLSMKDKGTQNMAGIPLETLTSISEEVYCYNYEKTTFNTMTKFIQQPTTKCVIFVIDSRKQHMINDSKGNDIRSNIKAIAKIIPSQCHILILCNKQDITDQHILNSDEISNILDINRIFDKNKHNVIGCSLTNNMNIDKIISYLMNNNIIKSINDNEEEEVKYDNDNDNKKKTSFINIFKRNSNKKNNEIIMIFGLDKSGKSELINAFNFGKKSKTSIAIFETETIKYSNCEFHVWNYEQRSWPMVKSFFINTSLVIFVIDGTQIENLKSDKKTLWTVDTYIKKLLGINENIKHKKEIINPMDKNNKNNPFVRSVKKDNDEKKQENNNNKWPLNCPFLFYINKCDLNDANMTEDVLEKEIQLSRLMKSKGIKYCVQKCSTKTKTGVFDGLIWCYNNGILTSIPEIKSYANENNIKLTSNSKQAVVK
eukprot:364635_1